jgi:hypothetical protein
VKRESLGTWNLKKSSGKRGRRRRKKKRKRRRRRRGRRKGGGKKRRKSISRIRGMGMSSLLPLMTIQMVLLASMTLNYK